ncbi:hypothetical protein DVH24_014664 [Malus domestica]|uniref:EF-hand domain-containing protein n=1 Tax=Malus domestica TaxID=3750 RepID=A0A498KK43_MALDO|nr:hypothetical protein DVH24_014664 [Malus domestica]
MAIAVAVAVVFVFSLSFVFTSRTDSSDLGDSGFDSGSFGGFGSTRKTVLALKSDPLKLLQAQEAQLAFSPSPAFGMAACGSGAPCSSGFFTPPVAGADFRAALGPCLRSISRRFAWYVPSRQAAGTSRDHSVAATTVPPPARIDECSFVAEETRKVFKSFNCNGDGKISVTAALSSSVQSLIDNTAVAIKIIDKSQADAAMEPRILREISAMRRLLLHSPSALRCSSFCACFIRHPPCSAPCKFPQPIIEIYTKKNIIENGIVEQIGAGTM